MKPIQVKAIQNLQSSACCCCALYETMKWSGHGRAQANSRVPALSQCWRMKEYSRYLWGRPKYQMDCSLPSARTANFSEDALCRTLKYFKIIFFLVKTKPNHWTMDVIRIRIRHFYIFQVFSLRFREKLSQSLSPTVIDWGAWPLALLFTQLCVKEIICSCK